MILLICNKLNISIIIKISLLSYKQSLKFFSKNISKILKFLSSIFKASLKKTLSIN